MQRRRFRQRGLAGAPEGHRTGGHRPAHAGAGASPARRMHCRLPPASMNYAAACCHVPTPPPWLCCPTPASRRACASGTSWSAACWGPGSAAPAAGRWVQPRSGPRAPASQGAAAAAAEGPGWHATPPRPHAFLSLPGNTCTPLHTTHATAPTGGRLPRGGGGGRQAPAGGRGRGLGGPAAGGALPPRVPSRSGEGC